ncbi:MAG TPA: hypothetical protein VKA34_16960 [Balneolales bacterium]|nr:hypothetical protein [Balneolales bacterium]
MKTLKQVFGISIVLLLMGGLLNTSQAQLKKELQYYRPIDQSGTYMFMPNKQDMGASFNGIKLYAGVGLTSQWQNLNESTAGINPSSDQNYNLTPIGSGFNLPTANLYLDAQMAEGIRLHLTSYLSSRHHNETYVKGGYLRVDALKMLGSDAIDNLMQYITIKVGDMESNYGDAHFLRSDNANTIYNPLVGNYLLDSFTTMDGAELYVFNSGMIAMFGYAGGMAAERPTVEKPDKRRPIIYGKLGYDSKIGDNMRFRLTGSLLHSNRFTDLYSGDRSGSRYYNIMADGLDGYGRGGSGDAWSGRVKPGFNNGFTSFMINPYLKMGAFNLFGIIESSKEMKTDHNVQQYSIEGQYFLTKSVYIAGRYNYVKGYLAAAGLPGDVTPVNSEKVNRVQIGGGWYLTKNILAKLEYVSQNYNNFPVNSVYDDGKFHGLMVEAAIGL